MLYQTEIKNILFQILIKIKTPVFLSVAILSLAWSQSLYASDVCLYFYKNSARPVSLGLSGDPKSLLAANKELSSAVSIWESNIQSNRKAINGMIIHGQTKAAGAIDRILDLSEDLQAEMRILATHFPSDSPINSLLKVSMDRMSVGKDNGLNNLLGIRAEFGHVAIRDLTPTERARIQGYFFNIESEFAELKVALSVENAVGKSVQARNLSEVRQASRQLGQGQHEWIADYFKALFPSARANMALTDIDVVFKNGRAWGEVKNFRSPLNIDNKRWPDILKQAKKLVLLKQGLQQGLTFRQKQVLPVVEELHFFFLGGIEEPAARQLRALGIIVH